MDLRRPFSYPDPETYFQTLMAHEFGPEYRIEEAIAFYGIVKNAKESIAVLMRLRKILKEFDKQLEKLSKAHGNEKQTRWITEKITETVKREFLELCKLAAVSKDSTGRGIEVTPASLCVKLIMNIARWNSNHKSGLSVSNQLIAMRASIRSIAGIFQQAEKSHKDGLSMRQGTTNRGRPVATADRDLIRLSDEQGISNAQLAKSLCDANVTQPQHAVRRDYNFKSYQARAERVREQERLRKASQRMKKRTT